MAVGAGPRIGPTGLLAARSILLNISVSKLLFTAFSTVSASPLPVLDARADDGEAEEGDVSLWVLYVVSLALVLLGGAFAGLTIALMGQDGIYLQVVARDHHEPQHKNAERVYNLLQRGKHWVLVTLLLSNVIVNETLPVVLDRCLGGGVAAVVGSTFLIVIFGEILPQSICVRYGLQIGGYMAKPVIILMYVLAPVAWPTAKLLDKLLGEDHGTVYKKSGLKTLLTLHRTLGEVSDRLNQDEVTIISAVLDLKEKPVSQVMTPMEDVFVMSEDTVLDEDTMDMILSAGYSRIPIHESGNPTNFVGMLLVKILITYDPEDCKLVRDFPLATLPETRPETSCLDIMNFFQEGKSHMVLVSERPGEDTGALGVVTLEDVIEELIGEEIIDESDVYVDVHKAIRRLTPAPKVRFPRRISEERITRSSDDIPTAKHDAASDGNDVHSKRTPSRNGRIDTAQMMSTSPKVATFMMRRTSAGLNGQLAGAAVPIRANLDAMRQHLRHLGPSNPAINPKNTSSRTVKIKPVARVGSVPGEAIEEALQSEGDETTRLLGRQISSKDSAQALIQNYGAVNTDLANVQDLEAMLPELGYTASDIPQLDLPAKTVPEATLTEQMPKNTNGDSLTTTLRSASKHGNVRSGSITENIVESRGLRKVVLETSSNDEDELATIAVSSSPDPTKPQSSAGLGFFSSERILEEESEEEEEEGSVEQEGTASTTKDGQGSEAADNGAKKKSRRKRRKGGSTSWL